MKLHGDHPWEEGLYIYLHGYTIHINENSCRENPQNLEGQNVLADPKNPGMSDWKGITYPYIPILFGWDWNPQSRLRRDSGFLGECEVMTRSCWL